MKQEWMKDVRLPGALWVIGIVGGTWLILTYVPQNQWLVAVIAVVLVVGKIFNIGTEQIETVIGLVKQLIPLIPPATRHVRLVPGSEGDPAVMRQPTVYIDADEIDKFKPNKFMRFLLG